MKQASRSPLLKKAKRLGATLNSVPDYSHIPLFPLHAVLFPQMTLPLHIFEERYRLMIAECLEENKPLGVVLLQSGTEVDRHDGAQRRLAGVGTVASIVSSERFDDGRYFVEVVGEHRFLVEEQFSDRPFTTARVKSLWDTADDPLILQPLYDRACVLFREYVDRLLSGTGRHLGTMQLPREPDILANAIGASLQTTLPEKQRLIEAQSVSARLQMEVEIMLLEEQAQTFIRLTETTAEGSASKDAQNSHRTIARVDPSYIQYFFSRN